MFGKEKSLLEQEKEEFENSPASDMYDEYKEANSGTYQTQPQNIPIQPQVNPAPYIQNQQATPIYQQTQSFGNMQLLPDEHVLWQGQQGADISGPLQNNPAQRVAGAAQTVQKVYTKVFAVIWLSFSVFWTLMASKASIFMAAFGIPFIIIGVFLLFGKSSRIKFQNKSAQGGYSMPSTTTYTLTTKRIMSAGPYGSNIDLLSNLFNISYTKTIGTMGTISYSKSVGSNMQSGEISNIPDVETVYNLLCNAINQTAQNR